MKVFNTLKMKRKDSISLLKRNSIVDIKKEIDILKSIDHPNVIKYVDCIEESVKTYVFLEYAENGSVEDILYKGPLSLYKTKNIFKQLIIGLSHLH